MSASLTRTPIPVLALFAVGSIGVAALAARVMEPVSSPPDHVGTLLAIYRMAAAELPPQGRVAFVATDADATNTAEQRFLAQYALAPRLIVDGLAGADGAVTGPRAPDALDAELAAAGMRLVRVTPDGSRVYRR